MKDNPHSLEASEGKIVFLLGLIAVVHVFVFSAIFPFFNVVDEQEHLDLVIRYSHADIPRKVETPTLESLRYIALFGTPEYLWTPSDLGGVIPQPPWTLPMAAVQDTLLAKEQLWHQKVKNHEASQPPLYYTLAGLWWRFLSLMGCQGGNLLYNLRFLNVILVYALVWISWATARRVFPENTFVRIAVPAFIALMPQTSFYSINNDVISPLAFGVAFLFMVKFMDAEVPQARTALGLGLCLGLTFLSKISNLPILAVAGVFLFGKLCRLAQQKKLIASLPAVLVLLITALAPMAGWMVWCKKNFGDYTGSIVKIHFLNWTDKPFAQWFHHPLFTLKGFWIFLSGNLSTFWQGEFLWRGVPLAIPAVNRFYVWTTLALMLAAVIAYFVQRGKLSKLQQFAIWFGTSCLAASLAFFALLSIKYDFHDCFYPSTVHPYFTSGRLMLGLLVPFLLAFALGLDRVLGALPRPVKMAVLVVLLVAMITAETVIDCKIFTNPYNWFHM